ncbi:MAG: threonine synthase [Oscillospiraceae bacterium]|jgi:threonine synthase|nr:threonine synthase [Oscillospiraceae bacterium]
MLYRSTRGQITDSTAAAAIAAGLASDGGLFVPDAFPPLPADAVETLSPMRYDGRAAYVMAPFLGGFDAGELAAFTRAAYCPGGFDGDGAAPVRRLADGDFFLELWHGPTCAFKDMALQIMPRFLTSAMEKTGDTRDVCVLVATSGDTGKAALEGFRDVPRTRIMVFYPRDGVSAVQRLQMTAQEGGNVNVAAVEGNFDDAQTGVKRIFADAGFRERLASRGVFLSSANSINWGRLLPQIVYYVSAYCDLVSGGHIRRGEYVNFCVPTGNFGNILAGYYAKKMGLPIGKLICASNRNDVLTQFINTGVYDRNREFFPTISPSMDILVSSNLERLLYELSGCDGRAVSGYMDALARDGVYAVGERARELVADGFACGSCGDGDARRVIADTFERYGYLLDPHTAVAYGVLTRYRERTGDTAPTVVVSTASPYKFCGSVLEALGHTVSADGPELIDALAEATGIPAPAPIAALKGASERFSRSVPRGDMLRAVEEFCG